MSTFNEISKNSGYYEYNYKKNTGIQLIDGPYRYSRPIKARLNDKLIYTCLLYTSPSPRDRQKSRMPSSA